MSGGGTQKTVTQNSAPAYAQPGLKALAGDAMSLYKSGAGYDQFAGSSVAPWSDQTNAGFNQLVSNAQQPNQVSDNTINGLSSLAGSGGLNGAQNQALQGYQDLAGQTDQNFNSALDFQSGQTMDAVNRQFNGLGGYGGSDNFQTAAREVGNQRNVAASNNFNNLQSQKLNANAGIAGIGQQGNQNLQAIGGLLPTLNDSRNYNANQLLTAGALKDQFTQAQLDDQINKFNTQQSLGRQKISDATGLLSGVVGNYGSQSTTSPAPSLLQQLTGGLVGGAGILGKLGG